jgi:hypothetical protein
MTAEKDKTIKKRKKLRFSKMWGRNRIRDWISIKMENRIRIGINMMPFHNTAVHKKNATSSLTATSSLAATSSLTAT